MARVEMLVSAALKHPWAMAVKAPVRDAAWRVRALGLRNPALTQTPRRLLFICKGNICRSPFAAHAAARILHAGPTAPECLSAGLEAKEGLASPPEAIDAARAHGIGLDDHRAAPLTEALVESSGLILVMEVPHRSQLRQLYPAHADRIFLLPLLDERPEVWPGYERYNIADPYGKPREAFEHCYRRIIRGLEGLDARMRDSHASNSLTPA